MNNITLVTGLWDIGRGNLQEGWSRSYQHYLDKFSQLLDVEENMIIFGDNELEKFVFKKRKPENTQFILRNLDWFKNNEFFPKIQKNRNNPTWFNHVAWLKDSTQAKLELYNPLVMSKIYLLHDAKLLDKFDSEYMFWIDAGLTNTIHPGYFTHDKVLDKLPKHIKDFLFVCFPYETTTEIHGFVKSQMDEYCNKKVDKVCRGGFFGGRKEIISDVNSIYYGLMKETLEKGLMGTEESLFTIMLYRYPSLFSYCSIESNGLMGKFFEDLKNDTLILLDESPKPKKVEYKNIDINKLGLYVITFNSPKQFETLIQSMLDYDPDLINKTEKYLLDNSTDVSTTPKYRELCEKYNFTHIKKNNLGICGGRQYIAEHFDKTDLDVMIFSEDDMNFYNNPNETCKNGFKRFTKNILQKSLKILKKENFDFLKLCFTEFYGDHSTQWAWYNVSQDYRRLKWPEKPTLPQQGLDPDSPKTKFENIKSLDGLPYCNGEIYYSNWTHIITKEGNRKMFLTTKWDRPHEQTWMSYIYQETVKDNIKPGLLLLSPIEHNRFDHYDGRLRKES